jgi:hypothetical protein
MAYGDKEGAVIELVTTPQTETEGKVGFHDIRVLPTVQRHNRYENLSDRCPRLSDQRFFDGFGRPDGLK